MAPIWITVLTGLGAGVIATLLTSYFQFWLNKQLFEQRLKSEQIAYERKKREEKVERIRQSGIALIQAASEATLAVEELDSVSRNASPERWGRGWKFAELSAQLRESRKAMANWEAVLSVDLSGDVVGSADFQEICLSVSLLLDRLAGFNFTDEMLQDIKGLKQNFEEASVGMKEQFQWFVPHLSKVMSLHIAISELPPEAMPQMDTAGRA